jgi:hypothetical protein
VQTHENSASHTAQDHLADTAPLLTKPANLLFLFLLMQDTTGLQSKSGIAITPLPDVSAFYNENAILSEHEETKAACFLLGIPFTRERSHAVDEMCIRPPSKPQAIAFEKLRVSGIILAFLLRRLWGKPCRSLNEAKEAR